MKIQMYPLPQEADAAYFKSTQVAPFVLKGVICAYTGKGTGRSWGRPGVTTTVVVDEPDFVALHVGFHHKHRGGQFWRYFVSNGEDVRQVSWRSLSDDKRRIVLDAYPKRAPSWARSPGELRINLRAKRVLNELREVLDAS